MFSLMNFFISSPSFIEKIKIPVTDDELNIFLIK